ncbi:hypothetical protein pdam_00008791 [Pocillopora damicornis]|uniref:Uncharacterized protein n=1 Tax=Pocillopora damicornis TaxID=46731 RepID=A0A3M6UA70_POCDA|nr:hypothetical protein pdam_00008791 [Pocillopora damicornis]
MEKTTPGLFPILGPRGKDEVGEAKVRTDDIFSIFLVQYGRRPVEALDMEEEERLQQYGRVNGKPFELSQEIFISKTDCNVFSKIEKFVSKRSNLKKF